jgi:hypothetical protein
MANKSAIKKAFYKTTDALFDDILKISKNNDNYKKLRSYYNQYSLVKDMNSKFIIDSFVLSVYPFKEQIENRNEEFFTSNEFIKDAVVDTSDFNFAVSLKKMWKTNLSDENKKIIWDYFNVLMKLCQKYISN